MTRLLMCGPGAVLLCGAVWTGFGPQRDPAGAVKLAMEGVAAIGAGLGLHAVKQAVGADIPAPKPPGGGCNGQR